jgi:hypothetical protein
MLKTISRILLALLGAGALLIASQAWLQPERVAEQLGYALIGNLGVSSFRADIGSFFALSGLFMLLAAWRTDRQYILPPLVLAGLALAARLATAGQTGFDPAYTQPITVEAFSVIVLLVAWTQFRKA